MAINYSYPKDLVIESSDLFLGIRASDNRTVNYTAKAVSDYLNTNAEISISSQLSFRFTISENIPKTISFPGGLGDGTLFSNITELVVSAIDASSSDVTVYLDYLVDSDILLSQQNEPNFFGHYKITGYTQNGVLPFYTLTLELIGSNGSIFDNTYYDLAPLNLNQGGGLTPSLQQVTDVGAVTTNQIESSGGFITNDGAGNYSVMNGSYFEIADASGNLITNFGTPTVFYVGDSFNNYFQAQPGAIDLANVSTNNISLNYAGFTIIENSTGDIWSLNFPTKPNGYVGTFAMLDDIPASQNLQDVTDVGNVTTNTITVKDAVTATINTNIYPYAVYSSTNAGYIGFSSSTTPGGARFEITSGGTIVNTLGITGGGPSRLCDFLLPIKATGAYTIATIDDIPSVSGYVPYTGATSNVNLGTYGLLSEYLEVNTSPTTYTPSVGRLGWNNTDGTLEFKLKGGNVTLQIGQEQVIRVVNKTTPLINLLEANYQVCLITGATGQRVSVRLAQGDTDANSAGTLGVVTENIDANQEGFITTSGSVKEINTTGSLQGETWSDGDILYLSPATAGALTNIKPTAPNHTVIVGYVEYAHAIHGKIYVKIDNGYELGELHNVNTTISKTTPVDADNLLLEDSAGSNVWKKLSWSNVKATLKTYFDTIYTTTAAVATQITTALATFKTDNYLDATSSIQTQLNSKEQVFFKSTTTSTAVTGTTSNTILVSALIPANTFTTGSDFRVSCNIQRVGGNAGASFRMYVNTTNSLSGATILGTFTNGATNLFSPFARTFPCRATNLIGVSSPTSSALSDFTTTLNSAYTTQSFNFTVDNYIIIAVQPSSALDSFTSELFTIKGNR